MELDVRPIRQIDKVPLHVKDPRISWRDREAPLLEDLCQRVEVARQISNMVEFDRVIGQVKRLRRLRTADQCDG